MTQIDSGRDAHVLLVVISRDFHGLKRGSSLIGLVTVCYRDLLKRSRYDKRPPGG